MRRFDVIVLGGGIIGAAIAEELARRGRHVALVERATLGSEASRAAAGILSSQMDIDQPGPFFDLCQASHRLYPAWVKRLECVTKRSLGYHRDGILYITLTAAQTRQMARRAQWQRRLGLKAEQWSPRDVIRHEPHVRADVHAGFFFPAEAQLDNVATMESLAVACRIAGVTLKERTTVTRLLVQRGRVVGVRTSAGSLHAPMVVSCLGGWSSTQTDQRLRWPVVPARGQMLGFTAPEGFFHHVVMSESAYGVQRRDGRLIVGSTVEFVGFDHSLTLEGMRQILTGFGRIVRPEQLSHCLLRETWTGLRPYSQDQMPILGAAPLDGLLVAAGHFRHGVLLAPVTAQVIADLACTGRTSVDLTPFSPARFR